MCVAKENCMKKLVKLELDETEIVSLHHILSGSCAVILDNEKNVPLKDLEKAVQNEDFETIEKLSTIGQEALICTMLLARISGEVEKQINVKIAKA